MEIAGAGLTLRPWRSGDEPALVRHLDKREVWRNMTNRIASPYTLEAAREWIGFSGSMPGDALHCAIVLDGEPVGGAGFQRQEDLHTRTAEIGYWLGQPYWGRGLASEALRCMTEVAWRDFDFVRLQAHVLDWNPASGRVLEKNGYRLEARLAQHVYKDGEICDALLWVQLRAASL